MNTREARLLGLAFVFLASCAAAVVVSPVVRSGEWAGVGSRWQLLLVLPVWASLAWLLHRTLRLRRPERDPLLLPIGMLLAGWGLVAIWRLSPGFGARQTGWLLVAGVACLEIVRGPRGLGWLRRYRYLWLGAGLALMTATMVFGTNPSGGEPRLWLNFGGVYFQPSEPMRLLLVAYLASYLADHPIAGHRKDVRSLLVALAPLVLMWGLSVLLLMVQRDLGTGTLFLVLLSVLLYVASGRWQVPAAGLAFVIVGGVLGYSWFDVVRVRLEAWVNPWLDPAGRSYQIVQALIAIASGGIVGRGPGLGFPGFVPIAHSDFVFSTLVEEWGLLGGLALLALITVLVGRCLRLAAAQADPFANFLGAGIGAAFGLQALLILGGVMRLLPMTGVTLPFVSYGGSSLLTSFIGLGLLLHLPPRQTRVGSYRRQLQVLMRASVLVAAVLALVLGWWTIVRAPALTGRLDNPRRGLAGVYVARGSLLDRGGDVLAESVGEPGEYLRRYSGSSSGAVIGYDSVRYGQAGLEADLDPFLRGAVGRDPIEEWWTELLTGFPPAGLDVQLTLDAAAQQAAASVMEGRRGAVVALDASSGEVLVAASSPGFDANTLEQDWEALVGRSDGPLVDRATRSAYQPGSVLAPLVVAWSDRLGLAGLDDPQTGAAAGLSVDGREIRCREYTAPSETLSLAEALRRGCPAPVAALGRALGEEEISAMMLAFGLDAQPPLVMEAAAGEAPTTVEVRDAGLAAAGQNGLVVTPLQVARAYAALASRGRLPPLQLVSAVVGPEGERHSIAQAAPGTSAISADQARRTLEALRGGIAGPLSFLGEAVVGPAAGRLTWFVGMTEAPGPIRVVVVLLEDAGPAVGRQIGLRLLELIGALP